MWGKIFGGQASPNPKAEDNNNSKSEIIPENKLEKNEKGSSPPSKKKLENDEKVSSPPLSKKNEPKSKNEEEKEYRVCGDVRTESVDKNLPDIEQEELDPVKSNFPECLSLKLEYDECFNNWFASSFIRGDKSESPCEDLLVQYTTCVKKGLSESNFELFLPSCLNSTDPNDGRTEEPRSQKCDYNK